MAYTRQQWESFNARIPAEERMSYDFYLTTLSVGERRTVQETVPPTLTIADERDKFLATQSTVKSNITAPANTTSQSTENTGMIEAIPLSGKTGSTTQPTAEESKAAQLAAIQAARELAMTPYSQLSAAERAAMSQKEKMDYLQAVREEQARLDAEERALNDPMKNYTQRPEAPPADDNYIYYYSWIGGVNSGSWKLYRAANTEANASYKSRAIGGETQATANSAVGANALVNQPTIDVKTGEVTTSTTSTATTETTPVRPAGTPAAYVYDATTKTWVKPAMPTDGKKYTWDDIKGWTENIATVTKTIKSVTYTGSGANRKRVTTYTDNTTETVDDPEIAGTKTIVSVTYEGTGKNRKRLTRYSDNTVDVTDDPDNAGNGNPVVTGNGFTQKDIDDAVAAALKKANDKTADQTTAAAQRASTIAVLQDRFAKYGLTSLASKIKELAVDGATEATITLQLQETPEYQMRFAANADRLKKGLTVLSPAEYLNAEDEYRQKLRDYGLKQFDTDAYVRQFISNDTSLTEISNRIVTAVQRVQNADPAVMKQLRDYYGITQESLVAYVLDPEQQFEKIKLQVASAEIGVEAGKQGLSSDMAVSEQLAKQGITQAEAQKGYATIADILPTAEKLSAIYGGRLDSYGQSEGEQEVFNSLASAQRKRQKLSAAEIAQFSGSSGLSKTSLLDQTKGKF